MGCDIETKSHVRYSWWWIRGWHRFDDSDHYHGSDSYDDDHDDDDVDDNNDNIDDDHNDDDIFVY